MGFENDKLGRKGYAEILTEIIDKPEKYKRNSDSDSFTMAIDSSWGTGKTEFLKMWEDELKKQEKYIVIKYNSWENDFAEEPLQSIIYTILSDEIFDKQNDIANGKKALKEAFETVVNLAEQSGIPGTKILTAGVNGMKKVTTTMFQETSMDEKIQEYKNYKSKIVTIKEKLEDITKDKKIILLIDELDRCKPIFAIKLLEAIKHIFNVRNMSFIFALDMTQLSYSVEKIYGTKIDASGYLCRFFDYITKMPRPNIKKYVEYLMEKRPLIRKQISINTDQEPMYNFVLGNKRREEFIQLFKQYIDNYELSLRDINTIYYNFSIFETRELKEVDNAEAYSLYLFLIILKYKNLQLFNQIFVTHNSSIGDNEYIKKLENISHINVETIMKIAANKKINRQVFRNSRGEINILEIDTKNKKYKSILNGYQYVDEYNEQTSLSGCLFYQDIENYEKIEEMLFPQYIHEKLELFDFTWE